MNFENTDNFIDEIEICRMCINSSGTDSKYYSITTTIQQQIQDLLTITLDCRDPSISTYICNNCLQNILNFAEFKENCIKNQKFFLKPSVKNEDQEIEISYPTIEDTIPEPEEEIDPDSLLKTEDDNVFKKSKRKTKKNEITIPATSHRKQSGKEIYQKLLSACEFCGKLIEKNRMEGHRNQHLGIRPYTCDENDCSKTFHCKHLLRLHKSSMHTGKQISCQICEKVFPSYRSLYAHKMRHENKDKFHCEQCNKKFNTRNSLKRHMPSHSGIRNYNCNFCSMSFYRNYNLLVHIRTHTKEKLYTCPVCQKPFSYRRLMKEHVVKSHPEYNIQLLNVNSSKYVKTSGID